MWKTIFGKLKAEGLNPYPPAMHEGLCTTKYCVVIGGTQMPSVNTPRLGQSIIEVVLFIPYANYPELELYKSSIRSALAGLPNLRKTGFESTPVADDKKKAMTMSIEYIILKKLEG